MRETFKKTPKDATEFEREQLRFLLMTGNPVAVLTEINPSLAWLPILAELKLIHAEMQLAPWIEKNFANADAIREVAANIYFFGPETADILEFRLNRAEALPSLLVSCWRLIIRYMRTAKRRALRNEWFDIAPRMKRGEQSTELLERLADVLRPKLRVGKRISWYEDEDNREPKRPTDLISIDYEIEEHITENEVLSAWPENVASEVDEKLLKLLTNALTAAVEDAIEAGVESNTMYGLSDSDVPSVAQHEQNAHRTGFLPIVRVMADLWTRLARKDTKRALCVLDLWRVSPFRLVRRLALFAAADAVMPAHLAAELLKTLPAGELFLAGSSVEVYRLVDARWHDIEPADQRAIETRIAEGPPADWFVKDQERNIDRSRFDLLGHLERGGARLGTDAQALLNDIRKRWPKWELRPRERAGFHVWHESASGIVGDTARLSGVPDDLLIAAAKRIAEERDFRAGDAWQALCQTDAPRILRALMTQANKGEWPAWAWHPFLWAAQKLQDVEAVARVAQLLLDWPKDSFAEIAADASWWLKESAKILDERLLWPLWDRIADTTSQKVDEPIINDAATAALNHPSGRLSEILLTRLPSKPAVQELPTSFRTRLNKLVDASGTFGRLARVRLALAVSFLFERAPEWTKERIVPLFDWSSADAAIVWSARKYANYIGSPQLFSLTKQPLLQLFARADASDEDLRTFADWLVVVMISNQAHQTAYPITPAEVRSALRQAAAKTLPSVGHRLAIEMEDARSDEKIARWRNVVGPIFQSIWPLDVELQTPSSTFKLVQILRASGTAFPEAAEIILPFIRPEDESHHTSLYSISEADDILYSLSPEKMLELVAAVVGEATRNTFGLRKTLSRIREHAPHLVSTKRFQKLLALDSN